MNARPGSSRRPLIAGLVLIVALVLGALWWLRGWTFVKRQTASPETVAQFHTSLAALDVEENELAARLLEEAIEQEPREPALWANLAVARLRLRETEAARQALERALEIAPDASGLGVLRAEVLEQAGEIEQAIEQLRQVHERSPDDIAATYYLASLLGQIRSEETDREQLALLMDILQRAPQNLRAQAEAARLAATLQLEDELRTVLGQLQTQSESWPESAREQLANAQQALQEGDFRRAAVSLTFMENVLKPEAIYQEALAQLGVFSAGSVGSPMRSFVHLELPPPQAADADHDMTFQLEGISGEGVPNVVLAVQPEGDHPSPLVVTIADGALFVGETRLELPGTSDNNTTSRIAVADLNFDFRQDLAVVGDAGIFIYLQQEDGTFQRQAIESEAFTQSWDAAWPIDFDIDGDLDLLVVKQGERAAWLRNNGDMTFSLVGDFEAAQNAIQLSPADLDSDGDVDLAILNADGAIAVWWNERNGAYVEAPAIDDRAVALTTGDADRDGRFDLVYLKAGGDVKRASWDDAGTWTLEELAQWQSPAAEGAAGSVFLAVADLDNNGAVDILASRPEETAIWLGAEDGSWTPLANAPLLLVYSIADTNGDGHLDLIGVSDDRAQIALNRSAAGYSWQVLRPRANTAAGDKRINSFGIGGRIEVRAGSLVQAATIQAPRVHFGLGHHRMANVARIVWPNGTVQAEFDLSANQETLAGQRLKGSCPWVFTYDGNEFQFVKDFIWRSPLGLRINAQATAGVIQTEDWIKLPGDRLAAVDGRYLIRITAELWETHFFDHIRLMVVDHPEDVEIFVDERFVPNAAPARRVIATTPPQPLRDLADHHGASLEEELREIDGRYADRFALGEYQGVAEEHWVEFQLPDDAESDRPVLLVGHGWVYPTDSSVNVALSQGGGPKPFGLMLEQRDADGAWQVVLDNLGFPAGKNKDVVISIPAESLSAGSRQFRLRTNMEIYWDWLGWCYEQPDATVEVIDVPLAVGDLRARGYSKLLPIDRRRPDTPIYKRVATGQPWLDLEGFYTRFGDVRELLADIDDRYVIMNAGDELVLEFTVPEVAANSGFRRDFVLVGDGWVKDGDFNTSFSRWVHPLPTHDDGDYEGPLLPIEQDPVYLRFPEDWRDYHTRYVTPRRFQQGLWPKP